MTRQHDPERDRQLTYEGGPLNGRSEWQPKAFWPLGQRYVDASGQGPAVWIGPSVITDVTRGRYVHDGQCGSGAARMVWVAPVAAWPHSGECSLCPVHGPAGCYGREDCPGRSAPAGQGTVCAACGAEFERVRAAAEPFDDYGD